MRRLGPVAKPENAARTRLSETPPRTFIFPRPFLTNPSYGSVAARGNVKWGRGLIVRLLAIITFLSTAPAWATSSLTNFDTAADGAVINNLYPGISLSTVAGGDVYARAGATSGSAPNVISLFSSGQAEFDESDGIIEVRFSFPQQSVSIDVAAVAGSGTGTATNRPYMEVYDAADGLVQTVLFQGQLPAVASAISSFETLSYSSSFAQISKIRFSSPIARIGPPIFGLFDNLQFSRDTEAFVASEILAAVEGSSTQPTVQLTTPNLAALASEIAGRGLTIAQATFVVDLGFGGTATQGDDYSFGGADQTVAENTLSYVLPANTPLASFGGFGIPVTATADGTPESPETVELKVLSGHLDLVLSDGTPTPLNESHPLLARIDSAAIITLYDGPPIVTALDKSDPAQEGLRPTNGYFVISIDSPRNLDLAVNYTLSGSATSGEDYAAPTGSVTIPAGDTFALVDIFPLLDVLGEGTEDITLTLDPNANYQIGSPTSQTLSLLDDSSVFATLTSLSNGSEDGPANGQFQIELSVPAPLGGFTIPYTLSGTATQGSDYQTLTGSVFLAEGETTALVDIVPIADSTPEFTETVVLTLPDSSNAILFIANGSPQPGISLTSPSITNETAPIIGGTTNIGPGALISLSLDPDDVAGSEDSFFYTATTQADGSWSVDTASVEPSFGSFPANGLSGTIQVAAAFSENPDIVGRQVLLIDTAPPTVAIDSLGDGVFSALEDDGITISGTSSGADGQTVSVSIDDEVHPPVTATATVQTGGVWSAANINVSGLNDGTIAVAVSLTDTAGNSASASTSFLHDTAPPGITIDSIGDGNLSASEDTAVTVAGSSSGADGRTVSLSISDGVQTPIVRTTVIQTGGSWSVTGIDASGLAEGSLTLFAGITDAAGNPASVSGTVAHDTTAPVLSFTSIGDGNLSAAEDNAVAILGSSSGADNQTVTISVSDGVNPPVTTNTSIQTGGAWSVAGLDVSGLRDGTLSFTASVTDAAGNSTSVSANVSHDTGAPTLAFNPIGDGNLSAAEDDAVAIGGSSSGADGQTVTVTISDGVNTPLVRTVATQTGGTWSLASIDLSGLADGSVAVSATASDAAGNETTASTSFQHHATGPTLTVNTPVGDGLLSASEDNAVTVTGTSSGAEGQTVGLSITDGVSTPITVSITIPAGGAWSSGSIDLSGLGEGSLSITANVTDAAGNAATTNANVLHDTTPPNLAIGPIGDGNLSAAEDDSVAVGGTSSGADGGAVSIAISVGLSPPTVTGTTTVQTGGNWSLGGLDLSGLGDGTLDVTATVSDAAGNTATASAQVGHDAASPTLAITTPIGDGNLSAADDDAVVLTGASTGADGQIVSVSIDDGLNSPVIRIAVIQTGGAWTIAGVDLSNLRDGNLAVNAAVSDAAGNQATDSVQVPHDATAPTLSIDTVGDGNLAAGEAFTVSGTSSGADGRTVNISISDGLNSPVIGSAAIAAGGTWSIAGLDLSGLRDGSLTVTANAQDAAGNQGFSAPVNALLDTAAPAVFIATPIGDGNLSAGEDANVTVSGTSSGADGRTLTLGIESGRSLVSIGTAIVVSGGAWTVTGINLSTLGDGTISLVAQVDDSAGNSGISAPAAVVHDRAAPTVTIAEPIGDGNLSAAEDDAVIISGVSSGADGQTVAISVSDAATSTVTATALVQTGGNWSTTGLNLSGLADGTLTATASVTDAAGNTGSAVPVSVQHAANGPTISIASPIGDGNLSASEDDAVIVTGTSSGADGQAVSLTIIDGSGGTVSGTAVIQTGGAWSTQSLDLSPLGSGQLTVTATVSDAAGNAATAGTSILHQATGPALQIDTPIGDGQLSAADDDAVTVSGTSSGADGQTVNLSITDGQAAPLTASATIAAGGGWVISGLNLSALPDGGLTVSASVVDSAGNQGLATPVSVPHDTVAPSLSISSPIGDGNLSAGEDGNVIIGGTSSGADGQIVSIGTGTGRSFISIGTALVQTGGAWSVTGVDLSSLPEGTISISAQVDDSAGNIGVATPATVLHDRTAPTVTISTPIGDGNLSASEDDAVSIGGTSSGADGQTLSLSIDDGTAPPLIVTAAIQNGGNWSFVGLNLSALENGVLTVSATTTDAAGNTGNAIPVTVGHNGTGPSLGIALPIGDGNLSASEDDAVAIGGSSSGADGQTVSISVSDGGASPVSATALVQTGGSWNVAGLDLSGLGDGTLTITASVADSTGNTATDSGSVAHDATAPVLGIDPAGDGNLSATEDDAITLSGTSSGADGRVVNLTISDGVSAPVTAAATIQTGGGWNTAALDLSALGEGTLTIAASVTDAAGNLGNAQSIGVLHDAVAPVLAVSSPIGDGNLSATEDDSVTIGGTSSGADGQTVSVSVSDGAGPAVTGTALIGTGGAWSVAGLNLSALADGNLTVSASVSDIAGNPGAAPPVNVLHDAGAPTLAVATPVGDGNLSASEDDNLGIGGSSSGADGRVVSVRVSDGVNPDVNATALIGTGGGWSVAGLNIAGLGDGILTVTGSVTDTAGNIGSSVPVTVLHDTNAPTLTVSTPIGDGNLSASEDDSVAIAGISSGADGRTVSVSVRDANGAAVSGTALIATGGGWNIAGLDLSGLTSGSLTIAATVTDPAGNLASAAAVVSHLTTNPSIAVNVPIGDGNLSATEDDNITISGVSSGADGQTVSLSVSDTAAAAVTATPVVQTGGSWSAAGLNLSGLADGTLTITASVADPAGNTGNASPVTVLHAANGPSLSITSPIGDGNLSAAEDDSVTVSGTSTGADGQAIALTFSDGAGNTVSGSSVIQTGGAWSVAGLDLSGLGNGVLAVTASVSDLAGNPASASATVSHQTSSPTIAITAPIGDGNLSAAEDDSVTVGGSSNGAVGRLLTVSVGDGRSPSITATATIQADGTWSVAGLNLSGLNDGSLTVSATVTDTAGNTGSAPAITVLHDTAAPVLGFFTPIEDGNLSASEDDAVEISGSSSGADGQTLSLSIGDGSAPPVTASTVVPAGGTWAVLGLNLSALGNGTLSVTASVADSAGNTATQSTTVLHDAAPPTLTMGLIGDGNLSAAEDGSVTVTGTSSGADGQTVTVTVDDGLATPVTGTAVIQSGGAWTVTGLDLSSLGEGTLTVTAETRDAAGNAATDSLPVQHRTTAPTLVIASPIGDGNLSAIEDDSVTIGGTSSGADGRSVSITIGDGSAPPINATAVIQTGGAWSVSGLNLSSLGNGTLTVSASVTDSAGNSADATPVTVLHNAAAPTLTIATPIGDGNLSAQEDRSVAVTGGSSGADGRTVSLAIADGGSGLVSASALVQTSGAWSIAGLDLSSLASGTLTVTATVVDAAGNSANASAVVSHATTAPSLAIVTPIGDGNLSAAEDDAVTVAGVSSGADGQVVSLTIRDGAAGTITGSAVVQVGGAWSIAGLDLSSLGEGTLSLTAAVTDTAGNSGTAAASVDHDTIAPTVGLGAIGDGNLSASEDDNVTVGGTSSGADGQTVSVTVSLGRSGPVVSATGTVQTGGAWSIPGLNLSALGDGSLDVAVTVTDAAGNSANASGTVGHRATVPILAIESPIGDGNLSASEDDAVTVSGTSSGADGATVNLSVTDSGSGRVTGTATVQTGGAWSIPGLNLAALANGSLNLIATVTDAAGNSTTATASVGHQASGPSLTIDAPIGDGNLSAAEDDAVTVSGTSIGVDGTTVNLVIDDGNGPPVTASAAVGSGGAWSVTGLNLSSLSGVVLSVQASVTDAAGNTATATQSVRHDPVASLGVRDGAASEVGPGIAIFVVDLDRPAPPGGLTVKLAADAASTAGSGDYSLAAGTDVVFAAGQTTQTVTLTPVLDGLVEGSESVVLTVQPGTNYLPAANPRAIATIADAPANDLPFLQLPAGGNVKISLIASNAQFFDTLSITSPAVAVAANTCSISSGSGAAAVPVLTGNGSAAGCSVQLDADANRPGIQPFAGGAALDLQLCVQTGPGRPCDFRFSNPATNAADFDAVIIQPVPGQPNAFDLNWEDTENGDDDFNDLKVRVEVVQPTVSIQAPPSDASEMGPGGRGFLISLDQPAPNGGLQIAYSVLGSSTATAGSDYQALSGSVVIPAGETRASIDVIPIADTLTEGPESVFIELQNGLGYQIPGASGGRTASLMLADTTPLRGDWSILQTVSGDGFGCSLLTDGTVKCWGGNASGQLGLGDTRDRGAAPEDMGDALRAVDLGAGRRAVQLAAGPVSVCALLDDGSLKCWGNNSRGGLGQGDLLARGDQSGELGDALPPIDLGSGRRAIQMALGGTHSCALLDDGAVKCWGGNDSGQLGLGDGFDRGDQPGEMGDTLPALDLGPGLRALELAAGADSTCARLNDGSVKCWGANSAGQLGFGDTRPRGGSSGDMGANLPNVDLGTGRRAIQLAALTQGYCARLDDGTVKCWGANGAGELGQGDSFNRGTRQGEMGDNLPAVDLGSGRTASEIAAHGQRVCVRLDDATVKCWGSNAQGGLGLGDVEYRGDQAGEMGDALSAVDLTRPAERLAVGESHTCAIRDDRRLQCWGGNTGGSLGLGLAESDARGDGPAEMGTALPLVDLGGPIPDLLATIQSTDPSAAEDGADPARFTVALNRAAPAEGAIVTYSVGGTAGAGSDYTALPGVLAFEPGQISATIDVAPLADNQVEGAETIVLSLQAGPNYELGPESTAAATLEDTPLPIASIAAADGLAAEDGGDPAQFAVTLDRPAPEGGISINLGFGGSGVAGTDYQTAGTVIALSAGQSTASFSVLPLTDNQVEGAETLTVSLLPGVHYSVGAAAVATAEIVDTPLPLASVIASDGQGAEAGGDPAIFTITLDRPAPAGGLQILYGVGGSAGAGTDFVGLSGSLAIAEGATGGTVSVVPVADAATEGPETILIALLPGTNYRVNALGQAIASIADQPPALVATVQASDAQGAEKGRDPGEFQILLSAPAPEGGLRIDYFLTGSAVEGEDFDNLGGSVVIPAGATSAPLPVSIKPDRLQEGMEKVVINLRSAAGYLLGSDMSAVVDIADTGKKQISNECQAKQLQTAITLAGDFALCQRDNLLSHDALTYGTCKLAAETKLAVELERIVETTEDCELAVSGSEVADLWGSLTATVTDPLVEAWSVSSPVPFRESARVRRFTTISKVVERALKAALRAEVRFLRDGDGNLRGQLLRAARGAQVRRVRNLAAGRRDYTGPKGPQFAARIGNATQAMLSQVTTPDRPTVLEARLGEDFGCARLNTLALKCWGRNDQGQLGLGDTQARGDSAGEMGASLPVVDLGSGRRVLDLAAGSRHVCALLKGGAVKCWGANDFGQLGLGGTADRGNQPDEMGDRLPEVDLGSGRRATAVFAGGEHSCALLDDGTVKCWGRNDRGQLGLGDTNGRGDQPVEMGDALSILSLGSGRRPVELTLGAEHTCARFDDGAVKCWGGNSQGALGLGDGRDRGGLPGDMGDNLPAVPAATGTAAIGAGTGFTCMRGEDGSVRCWGLNNRGQLGLGDSRNRLSLSESPRETVDLGAGRQAADLAVGGSHACVRLDNQVVKCWGANEAGQLGLGDTSDRGSSVGSMGDALAPVDFGSFGTPDDLFLGIRHGCARSAAAALRCWGTNGFGALGLGDSGNRGDQSGEMGDALPALDFGPAATSS